MSKKKEITKVGTVKESATAVGGNVSLKKIRRGVVVSTNRYNNHATVNLLYGLVRFIRQDFRNFPKASDNFIPQFLGVGVGFTEKLSATDRALTQELEITRRFDIVPGQIDAREEQGLIKLTLTSFITSNIVGGQELKELGLFTSATPGTGIMLAKVNILDEQGKGQTLGVGESLQIDWEITLGNSADLV